MFKRENSRQKILLELKRPFDACLDRLEYLIKRINLTNSSVKIEGETITELMLRRDVLQKKLSHYKDIVEEASRSTSRARNTEIRIITIISVKEWQKEIDGISKELRQLENKNPTNELDSGFNRIIF